MDGVLWFEAPNDDEGEFCRALFTVAAEADGAKGKLPQPPVFDVSKYEQGAPSLASTSMSSSSSSYSRSNSETGDDSSKSKNAEACKRFRETRKRKMEVLWNRNAELEMEREIFQTRILNLELELEALRKGGAGEADLEKENLLLRMEVMKHRAFVHQVMQMTTPDRVSVEESCRVLRSGIDSATGLVKGLLYSSYQDASWRKSPDVVETDGLQIEFWTQQLPFSVGESARRVNLRMEVRGVPMPPQVMEKVIPGGFFDPRFFLHCKHGKIADILPEEVRKLSDSTLSERLALHRYTEEGSEKEIVFVTSQRKATLFPGALGRNEQDPVDVTMVVQSSTSTTLMKEARIIPDVHDRVFVDSPCCLSSFVVPVDENSCDLIMIESYPLNEGVQAFVKPTVDVSGRINPEYVEDMRKNSELSLMLMKDELQRMQASPGSTIGEYWDGGFVR